MLPRTTATTIVLLFGAIAGAIESDPPGLNLERRFTDTVHPFLETYCFACHDKEKQKGKLDLSPYSTVEAIAQDYRRWEIVLEKLKAEEMPPEEAKRHPTVELRRSVIDWIQTMRRHEAERNAGDPGPVLARRLSNAEYDYTIGDLTGVDIRPTQEFPVDPANEAGFDNSGESLMMSPALVTKYLDAARRVAEHIVLRPKGFVFAPHPVVTESDRDKYCVKRIIDFYQRQPTDYADYFITAWRFKNRAALDKPNATLASFAAENGISSKYLATIWSTLTETQEAIGPIASLQAMWHGLPAPDRRQPDIARPGCERMRDFVVLLRQKLQPEVRNLAIRGIAPGSQPFVLWKDRQYAANRLCYDSGALQIQSDPIPPGEPTAETVAKRARLVPSDETARARYETAFERFCRIFPDTFYVSERGLVFLKEDNESEGRLLSAGFHLMVGYFRDDAPLYELMLDEKAQRELDALWQELNFITFAPLRQYKDFIFFERAEPPRFMQGAEFDFARSEDKDAISEAKIKQLSEAYLAKARRNGGEGPAIDAIKDYFENISADIRSVEQARLAAESRHLEALQTFAERAYRRPLRQTERDDLLGFYRSLRAEDGLGHEEAVRDTVVSVLMSPYFCYRIDPTEADERATTAKLTNRMSSAAVTSPSPQKEERAGERRTNTALLKASLPKVGHESGVGGADAAPPHHEPGPLTPSLSPSAGERVSARTGEGAVHTFKARTNVSGNSHPVPLPLGGAESISTASDGKDLSTYVESHNSKAVKWRVRPLSDYALANRLSYFLWSSMPDEPLLARAAAGDLHRPKVLVAEARRMLQDDRVRGLATEFGGNWLDFRRFEEHNSVDRERFKSFNNELRQAMFEEPIRFFLDLVREDRSVLDFLYADYTFVNPILAKHYGMPDIEVESNEWVRVDNARPYERGGLLPMSVFLTKNAPGLRTSPVKRGYWVIRRLLGEYVPPPPPKVPELPNDEVKLGDLTLRETLARHREDKSCAGCHVRFDAIGLVFEGYGPVGELRSKDFGGRPVDTHATFPGGSEGTGLDGLRNYLRDHRQEEFLDNLCRKLLVYALGRSVLLSDDAAIQDMRAKLAANDYSFSSLVECIVTSPQFLTKRGPDDLTKKSAASGKAGGLE